MASRLGRLLLRASTTALRPPLVGIRRSLASATAPRSAESAESPPPADAVEASSDVAAEVAPSPAPPAAAATGSELPPVRMPRQGSTIHNKIGKIPNNRAMQDFQRRLCVAEYEAERLQYKAMVRDLRLPYEIRRYYQDKLSRLPRNSSKVRVRNRCIVTGRGRGVYRRLRVSRIVLRELSFEDALVGVYKASW